MVAATALCVGGLLVAPTAHAADCTVNGDLLHISQSKGGPYSYTLFVNANGSTIGPKGGLNVPDGGLYGNVSGKITGTHIDFTINWDEFYPGTTGGPVGGKFSNQFTGDIGPDGIARGTSSGDTIPINIYKPGVWQSTDKLTCDAGGGGGGGTAGATHTVLEDVRLFDKPNGNDLGVDLKKDDVVTLNGPCPINKADNIDGSNGWCEVTDTTINRSGAVWGDAISK
jgi:hypothetical protein